MTWTAYRVSFRLLSPMHIGWRKLGNLQQTRPYVTGRSLWGALTARLTRNFGSNDYEGVGRRVDDELAFTYFYPSVKRGKDALWPWGDTRDEFEWTFLGSYASTALGDGHSAEAGSLHETEFIAPYTRNKEQVYLVGYIFEADGCNLPWKNMLDRLQLGGERGYGWGRAQVLDQCKQVKGRTCFGYEVIYKGHHPLIKIPKEGRLLAHTFAKDVNSTGTIEPFLGRETQGSKGHGGSFSDPKICWVPGSKVTQDETFQIKVKGIWEKQEAHQGGSIPAEVQDVSD
jgi:hypothetical protein